MSESEPMPAGREMDALVEESVMGGCAHRDIAGWYDEGPEGDRTLNCGQCHASPPRVPRYSTDIVPAFAVIVKLGPFVRLTHALALNGEEGWGWECTFLAKRDENVERVHGWANTAPLAICRAALAAMEARDA